MTISLPPAELREKAVRQLISKGIEPSPENLVKHNRRKSAPLYEFFHSATDHEWASYGRYEAARRILRETKTTWRVGGQKISTRMVEVVKVDNETKWASMSEILSSPELKDAYYQEVSSLLKQAQDKLDRLRLLEQPKDEAA